MDLEWIGANTSKFDLMLEVFERPDGLLARFEYDSDLFFPSTIATFAERFQVLLEGIVGHPEWCLADLPWATPAEHIQVAAGAWDRDDSQPSPLEVEQQSSATAEVEQRVIAIWKDVLQVETLEPNQDFFSAGGHSMLAIELIARLRDELEVNLPLAVVFEASTPAKMVKVVLAERNVNG